MSSADGPTDPPSGGQPAHAAHVVVVNSVMFKFISYWRVAAVVLCDLASTAYYIGGIVESSIGAVAPWFILAVMLFSYAVRNVYIESCSLFVRGGVYRIVKEALGSFLAKLAVSALMFDYILTGPISGVSAGQYIIGLVFAIAKYLGHPVAPATADTLQTWGSVIIACLITIYFFRQNLLGIHESSGKALKIMMATTVMAVIILAWCGVTLAVNGVAKSADGTRNALPMLPDLTVKADPTTGQPINPLGFLGETKVAHELASLKGAPATNWLSLVGVFGILVAFGHSILAMSGEETLAQVYREVESPKLKNFKRAALIVFIYSLVLTVGISFLAVLLIPDDVRMKEYSLNLIGGLAMSVVGPMFIRILLNAFVVGVGFLILAGAVNTAIIGSNGVLNRVAEDGVMPDWFLKPHSKFGTTYRVLALILLLQLFTIVASHGDVIVLGEAYAFGVVWSFVFQSLAMVVLRFRDRRPREFKVPLNITIRKVEIPIGLLLVFLVLIAAAVTNLFTKDVATRWGIGFTAGFMLVFTTSEQYYVRKRRGSKHEHREQFNRETTPQITLTGLGLDKKPYRKLVAIRSPNNLFMLEKAIAESDPATTFVIVMTAKLDPTGALEQPDHELDTYDQRLMTAVVERAEKSGKEVIPLIVPTNNPLFAVVRTAHDLEVQELIVGVSNKNTADEQLDQVALYWFNVCEGSPKPITVRIVSRDREVHLDLAGGNRVPKISERQARSVAELRAAGVGVSRVVLVHDGTSASHDLFQSVLTMLDPQVHLDLAVVAADGLQPAEIHTALGAEERRAKQLGRELSIITIAGQPGPEIARLARDGRYDLIIAAMPEQWPSANGRRIVAWLDFLLEHAPCPVFVAAAAAIPMEVDNEDETPTTKPTR
ncbi:MAG TPA: amino acid permease [Pirellulales bacterium]|jgi:nucleotide-binding universal stress UspA family protein|nr:amino acid permease [Pirellulales bacterium]